MRNKYKIVIRKSEGKRPHGKPRHRWEDKIRIDLREIGWEDVDWMHLTWERDPWWTLVNSVMNIQVPQKARDFMTS
jgi:hypothetical protein